MARRGGGKGSGSGSAQLSAPGLPALRRDLLRLAAEAQALPAAHAAAGRIVAAAAAARAPRATGELAASVRATQGLRGATVTAGAAHAVPVEDLRRFLWGAAQATEPAWLQAYVAALDRATGRLSGKTY